MLVKVFFESANTFACYATFVKTMLLKQLQDSVHAPPINDGRLHYKQQFNMLQQGCVTQGQPVMILSFSVINSAKYTTCNTRF
jgi:hypothetical protein